MIEDASVIDMLAFIFGTFFTILGLFTWTMKGMVSKLSTAISRLQSAVDVLSESIIRIDLRTSVELARINERCIHHGIK